MVKNIQAKKEELKSNLLGHIKKVKNSNNEDLEFELSNIKQFIFSESLLCREYQNRVSSYGKYVKTKDYKSSMKKFLTILYEFDLLYKYSYGININTQDLDGEIEIAISRLFILLEKTDSDNYYKEYGNKQEGGIFDFKKSIINKFLDLYTESSNPKIPFSIEFAGMDKTAKKLAIDSSADNKKALDLLKELLTLNPDFCKQMNELADFNVLEQATRIEIAAPFSFNNFSPYSVRILKISLLNTLNELKKFANSIGKMQVEQISIKNIEDRLTLEIDSISRIVTINGVLGKLTEGQLKTLKGFYELNKLKVDYITTKTIHESVEEYGDMLSQLSNVRKFFKKNFNIVDHLNIIITHKGKGYTLNPKVEILFV